MSGGPPSPPPAPTVTTYGGQPNYIPTGQPQADTNLQNLQSGMYDAYSALPGTVLPQLRQITSGITSNAYAPAVQSAAGAAGGYLSSVVAPGEQAGAATLQNLGINAAPYGATLLATGFDPQGALYNRTQQQVADQLNAVSAANGLSGTPYGAGVVGQGLSNFNIDWQNQELGRQLAAASGYGQLTGTVGQALSGAGALGTQGAETAMQGSSLPYQTSLGIAGNELGGLSSLVGGTGQTFAPAQQLAGDYTQYLGLGNNASGTIDAAINSAYGNQLAAFNAQQQANQGFFGDLGSLFGGVTDALSPGGFLGGGGPGGAGGLFDLSGLFAG